MNKEVYSISKNDECMYSFLSDGKKGIVYKAVFFQLTDVGYYNLALMDYLPSKRNFSDSNRTNNGDMTKTLATVVSITLDFIRQDTSRIIYIEANTKVKNLLYNRLIRHNMDELLEHLEIVGVQGEQHGIYEIGKTYDAFYIYHKIR